VTALPLHEVEGMRRATDRLRVADERARNKSVLAVRALEHALMRAVAGAQIRGLAILAWPCFRGASVVGRRARFGIDTRVERGGSEQMVVLPTGELAWASIAVEDGQARTRGVLDRELRSADVEDFARAVLALAARHEERCDREAAERGKVAALADRLRAALADTRVCAP
jgi:hypothetical protein